MVLDAESAIGIRLLCMANRTAAITNNVATTNISVLLPISAGSLLTVALSDPVNLMPEVFRLNSQARIIAIGNPPTKRKSRNRMDDAGSSRAGERMSAV